MVNARFFALFFALFFARAGASIAFSRPSGLQKYQTGLIPLSYGKCAALDLQVTAAFQTASGAQIISHQCVDGSKGTEIEITYQTLGDSALALTSTRNFEVGPDLMGRGYIETEKDCEARKQAITAQFKTATGLDPFFSRCMVDQGVETTQHPWHVAIDAIGVGEMTYQYLKLSTSEGISSDPKSFILSIRDYLTDRGEISIVDVIETLDGAAFGSVVISTFTKEKLILSGLEGTSTKLAADCVIEAAELQSAANASGISLIATGCIKKPMRGHMIKSLLEGHHRPEFQSTGINFTDINACRTERPKTLTDMRAAIGDDVIAIMCQEKNNAVEAIVVLKPEYQ